jgi:hypothetical protein
MSNLILRGAWVAHVVIQSNESGCFCRLNMRADFSDTVRHEMGWDELGIHSRMIEFDGELPFGRLTLKPQQETLTGSSPELKLEFEDASGFRAVRVKEKDKESTRVELRFQVRSTNPDAAAFCQEYKRLVRVGLGELRMVWSEGGQLDESEAANAFAPTEQPGAQLSMVEGMKVGARGRKKHTRQMEEAVVTVDVDPDERARLDAVTEQRLN